MHFAHLKHCFFNTKITGTPPLTSCNEAYNLRIQGVITAFGSELGHSELLLDRRVTVVSRFSNRGAAWDGERRSDGTWGVGLRGAQPGGWVELSPKWVGFGEFGF